MKIKDKILAAPLLLAPMAGLTHSALRTLVLSFGGAGLLSTEMLSARRLPKENQYVSPYLVRTKEEFPLSYQLLITDVQEIGPAIVALHRMAADVVDLNFGCPAPRIRKAGGGSSLMSDPLRVRGIIRTARRRTNLPLTAKIRLGERLEQSSLRDFCTMLQDEGLDMLTVHARLRGESFARKPHWEWVEKVKNWLDIPVVANGGIFSVKDAARCLSLSNADGLMLGRAAAQKPWLFAAIAREIYGISVPEWKISLPRLYGEFALGLTRFRPERRLGRLKEFTHYFSLNYAFGHHLAMAVQKSTTLTQAWRQAVCFFERTDPEGMIGVADEEVSTALSSPYISDVMRP
ncbi:MAG TPA: tRNA-dihydrouridine synthase family protein [Desulfobulbaceae bacterium]|nr:tRNA-dihydrouridine synthase family protein [Desulfobulbaceae bacterium]